MNVMEVQHAVYLRRTHKAKHMQCVQVKHGVLYLHHPLKHVGQREEGDEHIFRGGLQCALDDNIHRGVRGGGRNGHRWRTEAGMTGKYKAGERVDLSQSGIFDVKQRPLDSSVLTFDLIQIS